MPRYRGYAVCASLWVIALAAFLTLQFYTGTGTGTSMLPTIRSTDGIVEVAPGNLHVGDIALYRDFLGVTCHRIVAINGPYYTFKGDNNSVVDGTYITADRNITRSQIIAKVVFIIHDFSWFLGVGYGVFLLLALLIAIPLGLRIRANRSPASPSP